MSNEVVDWKAKMAASVVAHQEAEQASVSTISLASGTMTLMDQQVPNNTLDAIIVASGVERTLYLRDYDPDDKSPPDCYAQKIGNDDVFRPDMIPAANVPEPMAATCAVCQYSKLGSASRGKGPACKTRRRLVLAPASVVGHPDKLGKQLVLLNVPPTSGQNYTGYLNKLLSTGLPPEAVVTKIKYGPSKKYMFEMGFDLVAPITDDATLSAIFSNTDSFTPLILGGYNYEEEPAPAPEPAKKSKKY